MKASDGIKQAENSSNGKYHKNGIFTRKSRLLSIEDCSNNPAAKGVRPIFSFNSGFQPEQCLKLNFAMEGKEEGYSIYLFSKYLWKDDKKTFAGWRFKNNPILDLLVLLLGDPDISTTTWEIPQELFKIHDVDLITLSYCTGEGTDDRAGKCNFQTWDKFELFKEDESNDELLVQKFENSNKWLIDNHKYLPNFYDEWKKLNKNEENPTDTTNTMETTLPF